MRFEKRLDIVQQGQFAVNGKQRRNHALVHIIAGSADAHGNFIFFLLAREKFDNTLFAGKVNMIRRQHFVKLSAFGVANFRCWVIGLHILAKTASGLSAAGLSSVSYIGLTP